MTITPDFVPFVAATVPAKIDRVSNTTLFHIAAKEFNDALDWVSVAQINGVIDPWITSMTEVQIPPVLPTAAPTGELLVTPGGATAGIPQT